MPGNSIAELKLREKDARRRLILNSARELFAEKDFQSVTVRQIASAAGVSIGTIYNYYDSLTELFLDVFLKSAEDILARIDAEMAAHETPLNRLCSIYIDFLNENMTFYQMMGHFMLGGELSTDGTQKLNRMMRALMDRVETAILAEGPKKNARLMAHALFSALNGIMITYARYPGRNSEEISRHTRRLAAIIGDVFEVHTMP